MEKDIPRLGIEHCEWSRTSNYRTFGVLEERDLLGAFRLKYPIGNHCLLYNLALHFSCETPYRVGSANFSRRKIGNAHDKSADSENVAGASEPNVQAHFIFCFENGQGNQIVSSIHDQNTAETSQPQAQPTNK